MKTSVCKGCPWLRGVNNIGAGYCAKKNTMIFETDPACSSHDDDFPCEVWLSYGESGQLDDNMVAIFWNKPVYEECEGKYFDYVRNHDCEAEFKFDQDSQGSVVLPGLTVSVVRALLPALKEIKGTKKLLRVTIDIVDQ